ncbi:MAG: hypothetical protein ACOCTQ_00755 [Planctomycetota bacterium]
MQGCNTGYVLAAVLGMIMMFGGVSSRTAMAHGENTAHDHSHEHEHHEEPGSEGNHEEDEGEGHHHGGEESWAGVDHVVIEEMAEEAGRPARESLINIEGDLLLLVFLLAGAVGGCLVGYYYRVLFVEQVGGDADASA